MGPPINCFPLLRSSLPPRLLASTNGSPMHSGGGYVNVPVNFLVPGTSTGASFNFGISFCFLDRVYRPTRESPAVSLNCSIEREGGMNASSGCVAGPARANRARGSTFRLQTDLQLHSVHFEGHLRGVGNCCVTAAHCAHVISVTHVKCGGNWQEKPSPVMAMRERRSVRTLRGPPSD
jgi:hypothetical protein